MNLTLNTYTQWYWKIDLHNLLHFLYLREDAHAQYEIQAYAEIILNKIGLSIKNLSMEDIGNDNFLNTDKFFLHRNYHKFLNI